MAGPELTEEKRSWECRQQLHTNPMPPIPHQPPAPPPSLRPGIWSGDSLSSSGLGCDSRALGGCIVEG